MVEQEQVQEVQITDESLWYVIHTYSGYEDRVKKILTCASKRWT